jgi:hypothetical protein
MTPGSAFCIENGGKMEKVEGQISRNEVYGKKV